MVYALLGAKGNKMNINEVVQNEIKNINFEEIARKAASEQVQEAVKKCVDDMFSYHSDFKQNLKEHLKKELSIDFSVIKLPEYRDFLLGSINNALASFTTTKHAKEVSDYVNTVVIGESRDEIEFSKFWDELCEMITDACDESDDEKYHVQFGQDGKSYSSRNYYSLTISIGKESYSYNKSSKSEVIYAAFSDGEIYHMRPNDDYELSRVFTWLKTLKFRKTTIKNLDCEEVSLPYRDY